MTRRIFILIGIMASFLAVTMIDVTGQAKGSKEKKLDELLELPSIDSENMRKEELEKYLALAEKKASLIKGLLERLKERESNLITLEKTIDEKLRKIDDERLFLGQTIQKEVSLQNQRLQSLVEIYTKMDPKKAAPVISKLDKELASELLDKLSKGQVTKILEAMPPESAVQLTEKYSRMHSMREFELLKEVNASLRQEFEGCSGTSASSH